MLRRGARRVGSQQSPLSSAVDSKGTVEDGTGIERQRGESTLDLQRVRAPNGF